MKRYKIITSIYQFGLLKDRYEEVVKKEIPPQNTSETIKIKGKNASKKTHVIEMDKPWSVDEITPYLPYNLKLRNIYGDIFLLKSINNTGDNLLNLEVYSEEDGNVLGSLVDDLTPILKPIRDLKYDKKVVKELKDKSADLYIEMVCDLLAPINTSDISYKIVNVLIKNHYDIYGKL